jgi:HlyD family secretion protein
MWPRASKTLRSIREHLAAIVDRSPGASAMRARVVITLKSAQARLAAIAGQTPQAFAASPRASRTLRSIQWHLAAIVGAVVVLAGGVGVLGAKTELSGAVVAAGSLVVESNVKKVQHPVGGTVGELLVKEGSHVSAGDILVRLDETVAKANLATITKSLWELSARGARLEAERDGASEVLFPDDLLAAASDPTIDHIVTGERKLFTLRREALLGQKAQLHERVAQLNDEIKGLTEQTEAKGEEIRLVQEELGGVRDLWDKKLVPITRLTALERDAARLKGERGQLVASTAQTKGKISEIEVQTLQIDQKLRSDVAKELADIRAKSAELEERRVAAEDLLQKLDVRSPQNGIVQDLSVHARGSVVGAGEQIMLIVPQADALVVEVRISPQDIDQVQLDQAATLRFPNFNQRTTPELSGTVIRIAADVTKDEKTGSTYYLARIKMSGDRLEADMKFVPGMPVDVFIRTRDRTLLSYLVKPLVDQAARAFREK